MVLSYWIPRGFGNTQVLILFTLEDFQAISTGSYNTAIGSGSLYNNTTAFNNTAVGYQAGFSNQTGAIQHMLLAIKRVTTPESRTCNPERKLNHD
jgi:hypothetical protein